MAWSPFWNSILVVSSGSTRNLETTLARAIFISAMANRSPVVEKRWTIKRKEGLSWYQCRREGQRQMAAMSRELFGQRSLSGTWILIIWMSGFIPLCHWDMYCVNYDKWHVDTSLVWKARALASTLGCGGSRTWGCWSSYLGWFLNKDK